MVNNTEKVSLNLELQRASSMEEIVNLNAVAVATSSSASPSSPNSKSGTQTGENHFRVLTPGGTGVEETTPTYEPASPDTRFSR